MFLREPYKGPTRKLVLAFDVGTTFSGVSYCILDPGEVPVIRRVARYPAQESFGGNSKIPSILYYDLQGHVRAVGAEVLQEHVIEQAEDEGWVKLAWWKLHLRAKHLPSSHIRDADIEPLPQGKSAVEVLADFMRYLFQCARSYIQESHLNLWRSVENSIEFVLTHPNGWEGQQQQQIRRAVELAGLISSKEEQSHVHLLTEGEASLHFCVTNVIASDTFFKTPLDVSDYDYSNDEEDQSDSQGVIVVDAGGGTIDLSAYSMKLSPTSFKEISPAECSLQGSVFVTSRARTLLQKKLSGSKRYSDPKIVAQMADIFDKSAKLWFRKPDEPSYIKFGTIRDKDLKYNIRSGQLKLAGQDIADLFEPSIKAIIEAVEQQRRVASTSISLICLVGGFAASDWLFVRLQEYFLPLGISFCRHDAHVNKAVADGAVSFYIDHLVSSQVARAIYGIECNALYNQDPEHPARQHKGFVDVAGRLLIPDYFQGILLKGTQVSELREFRKSFHTTRTSLAACKIESTDIMCYKCALQEPQWLDVERCMPAGGQPHVDYQKLSVPSGFQMDNSQSQGNKLTSEEQLAMSNSRSASTSSATSQFRSTMVRTPSTGGFGHPMHVNSYCTHFKRSKEHGDAEKVSMSQQGHSSGIGTAPIPGTDLEPVVRLELSVNRWVPTSMTRKAQPGVDSPELVDRNVKALLNKLTMEKFETISDQIIHWANKSVNEKDGRTLVQVIRLVYEKAIDEAACNEMYARLCRKMMEQISPEVQDDGIKNTEGKPIAGGQLFRKYLLNRCQEDFERGWFPEEAIAATAAAKASDDHATKAARKTTGTNEAELRFEEYYAARKARRQGLGLIKFIGELFKLQMLTERIMHECVKKLLGNVEDPVEKEIESLCQLLKTVGQLLDTPKARAHMDVYFTHMKELGKSLNVSSRTQFMLQDVIELRDRKWVSQNAVAAPTTIAAVRELAAKEKAAAEKESFNHQISMSCGGSRRGDKVSTTSGKTPTPLPSQSAWAKGPPQSNSSAAPSPRSQSPAPTHVASPIAISHSRRPSALGQGVSVKDGVSVPRNNVGSVVRPASVVFGSIDDASAPLSSSPAAIPAVKTEVVKSFGSVPATSSNHVNGKTSASASATGSSKQPPRPSLSSTPSNSSALSSTAATSTASTPKPSRADIAKLFQNPSSSSSQPSSDTSSPSTRPSNLPSHHQSSSSSSQQPQQPSQLGTHSYSQFVPNNMRPPQQPSGTPRSPAFSRAVPNVQGQSRQGAGPGGPGGPPIPASPRMTPHPHQAPPGGIPPQVPMQPMSWGGYYYMDPYQPQPPWGYYAMPSQHMHQQPHPQHVPHVPPPHQPGPLPMSPRPAAPQLPGTPTMAHAIPHPPHTPQPPPSMSSPPPTPSTANAPRLNTNARDFIPSGRSTSKVTIKSQDGMEVTLDALKKHSPQPPTVPIPPASPVVTSRRQPSVSVRIESEESKRAREENARKEQEKKDEEERAKKDAIEKKKREAEEETKRLEEEEAARKRKAEDDRIRMEEEEKERIRQAEAEEKERLRQEEEDRLEAERQEAEQARIALEEEEQKQQDALEAEEAQLEADEANDIVQTPSPASESQEPEDGEVSEHDEAPVPQLNGDSGKKLKESLRIDTSAMPPPTEIPRRRPGPLDLASAKRDVSAPPPSALLTARVIENLSEVAYPEGIKSPKIELNANVKDGRFRYDRDFLMQFMHICKEKPPTLPALDVLGIEPVDQTSFPMARGGSGRHRNASGAMPVSANRQASVGLGIGGFQKPSIPSGFQMGNFQSPGSKLTSEERFAMSNSRSASTSSASSQYRSAMVRTPSTGGPGHPMHGTNRIRSKRGERRGDTNKTPMSQDEHGSGFGAASILGAGFEPVVPLELSANRWVPASTTRKVQPDVDSPELVDRKVKALLNKLTMEKFETISDQIIHWANKSVNEKDGRTLIQVIRLVFEKATDEAAWSEMYARLCRKMMEQISPEVQDDGIKNTEGKPIAGGQLFRKYLLNRCQEDFERGWFAKEATAAAAAAKASDDHATKAANDKKSTEEAELYSDEYYAAQKAKRQGLGLIKFIGELFKLQMLTERIMHECVKKLLGNVENPEEEEIESLCQLLKTVGQLLDTPKARAHMDVYFTRMKELGKSLNVSSRMQFMLQDVIELRDRKWVSRNAIAAPTTIAAVHELAAKEKAAAEKESFNRQISMSRGGSRRGDNRNQEHGPDGWAVAGGSSVPRAPPKAGDLSQFGKISKGPAMAMVMGPSGVFAAGKKDSKRETLSRTNSSSNMFHMLSQNPELAAEASTKPSRSSSRKPSVDLGHAGAPEPAVQRRKLQLLPRSVLAAEENATTPSEEEPESAPTAMSEADVKKKIDEDVKEFFAVRNLQEAEVYFTNLPDEHRFRLVDKLVASALESKEADAMLVGDFFAQATSNGQCSLEVFEEGFMPMAEFLDDIAIDAPKAFDYMAIMLKGAGFENEPERLQRIASKLENSDKLVSLVA